MNLLERALTPGSLRVEFQPIVSLETGAVVGYEGLSRGPRGTSLESANVLFEYVRRKRAEEMIDRATTRLILRAANVLGDGQRVSINVHAVTLIRDTTFPAVLRDEIAEVAIRPENVTVELLEFNDSPRFDRLVGALSIIREMGCSIAVDDVGAGTSNFRTMIEVQPDWLKLDRWIVNRIRDDRRSRIVTESVSRLASELGAEVVAEGIECTSTRRIARELGVSLGQGYLFGRPVAIENRIVTRPEGCEAVGERQ